MAPRLTRRRLPAAQERGTLRATPLADISGIHVPPWGSIKVGFQGRLLDLHRRVALRCSLLAPGHRLRRRRFGTFAATRACMRRRFGAWGGQRTAAGRGLCRGRQAGRCGAWRSRWWRLLCGGRAEGALGAIIGRRAAFLDCGCSFRVPLHSHGRRRGPGGGGAQIVGGAAERGGWPCGLALCRVALRGREHPGPSVPAGGRVGAVLFCAHGPRRAGRWGRQHRRHALRGRLEMASALVGHRGAHAPGRQGFRSGGREDVLQRLKAAHHGASATAAT